MIASDNKAKNVLGTLMQSCCLESKTGFYRDGSCNTDHNDRGKHIVCAIMTDKFLQFSKSMGNDLTTPILQYNFLGLKAGDKWCLCIKRWKEALTNNAAPKVILESCHQECLKYISIEDLKMHCV